MPAVVPQSRRNSVLERDERPRMLGRIEARQMFEPGRATLGERITATWTQLVDAGSVDCPVCAAELRAGAPCPGCGSALT